MAVVMLSDCMPPRSTSISCSSQMGLPGVAASQKGNSWKVNHEAFHLAVQTFQAHHQIFVL